jgi:hypothetical protein
MDETEWTRGLGEGFCEYFYGEWNGDFPLDRAGVKFNNFEKRYITAVFRELCLYRFWTNYTNRKYTNGEDHGELDSILSLFRCYNSIGDIQDVRDDPHMQPYLYRDYEMCPRHPIQELITRNYRRWTDESDDIIQGLIRKKFKVNFNNKHTLSKLMVAAASSLHKRLGQNSAMSVLSPEMLEMTRDIVIQKNYDEIDAEEFAYLNTLE